MNLYVDNFREIMIIRAKIIQPKFNFGLKVIRNLSSFQRRESSCLQKIVLENVCNQSSRYQSRFFSQGVPKYSQESSVSVKEELIFQVPDKPAPPPASQSDEIVFPLPEKPTPVVLTQLGEPSLESLGLASWWPAGRMQYFLENVTK